MIIVMIQKGKEKADPRDQGTRGGINTQLAACTISEGLRVRACMKFESVKNGSEGFNYQYFSVGVSNFETGNM